MPELAGLVQMLTMRLRLQAMIWSVSLTLMVVDDAAMLAMLFS
jgi:hypothetical protein